MSAGAPPSPLLAVRTAPFAELREMAAAGRLYAVLDACDAPAVPEKARELGDERAVSLYRGSADEMYWAIAPYLFVVDEALLEWIVETLWEEPFGIFAVADAGLDEVRRHFRRFLVVQAPEGEQWYFRYYDPRVLPTFLSHSTLDEQNELFGPLRAFGVRGTSRHTVELIARGEVAEVPKKVRIRFHRPT